MTPTLQLKEILDVPITSLGEGLCYVAAQQYLYWVDILTPRLFQYNLKTSEIVTKEFCEPVCWVNSCSTDQLIIGLSSGIYQYDFKNDRKFLILKNQDLQHNIRLNDAKTDRSGNLFFGTMDIHERSPVGKLFRLISEGECQQVDSGYTVSNGPAFNRDGNKIYTVSSSERLVYVLDMNVNSILKNKRIFIRFPEEYGYPDGITVDENNNVWVACWGGSAIICYSCEGHLLNIIDIPAPYVTNIIFAGKDYREVFVTTATHPMSENEKILYPNAGKVFHFKSSISGLAERPIKESTLRYNKIVKHNT